MNTQLRSGLKAYPKSLAYIITCVTIILVLQVIIVSRG